MFIISVLHSTSPSEKWRKYNRYVVTVKYEDLHNKEKWKSVYLSIFKPNGLKHLSWWIQNLSFVRREFVSES